MREHNEARSCVSFDADLHHKRHCRHYLVFVVSHQVDELTYHLDCIVRAVLIETLNENSEKPAQNSQKKDASY